MFKCSVFIVVNLCVFCAVRHASLNTVYWNFAITNSSPRKKWSLHQEWGTAVQAAHPCPMWRLPSAAHPCPMWRLPSAAHPCPMWSLPSAAHPCPMWRLPSATHPCPMWSSPSAAHLCPMWRLPSAAHPCPMWRLPVGRLQVLESVTSPCYRATWYFSNQQIHEYLRVPFFAENIRALTAGFDSKLSRCWESLIFATRYNDRGLGSALGI